MTTDLAKEIYIRVVAASDIADAMDEDFDCMVEWSIRAANAWVRAERAASDARRRRGITPPRPAPTSVPPGPKGWP